MEVKGIHVPTCEHRENSKVGNSNTKREENAVWLGGTRKTEAEMAAHRALQDTRFRRVCEESEDYLT